MINTIKQLTGGEAIVQGLRNHNVDTLFGLPGVQNDWLYNALYDQRDHIRVIHTRHEQGAGYMALGYAMARGDVGVCSVVPGPGFLNASAALATAYGLNAKVLCLSGQIPSPKIGKDQGQLHEIPDQLSIMQQLTKWSARVNSPAEAPVMVAEAFRQLHSGRPRPVGLEVPMDVLARREAVDTVPANLPTFMPPVDEEKLEAAAKLLGQAENPMIYVGGGAQGVSEKVTALAEALQAPVVCYRNGHGVLDARHPLSLHLQPSHEFWKKTDVVLGIGSYMRTPLQGWGVDDNLKVIHLDVDPSSHTIIRKPDIALTALAEDAVPLLLERVAAYNSVRASRTDELMAIKADWAERTAYLEEQLGYLKVIRHELGEDGIFVDELTQVGFASRITYPTYKPRTFISTGYQGTLGYGFQTALGVKVAKPDTPVISIAGDGGLLFGVQELATAVQHKIGLVTLIFNNNQYGNVQQMQKNLYGNRVIATDLHNPDFVKLAEAYGANGFRTKTLDELRGAIRKGFESDLPTLIDIPVGDLPSVDRFRGLPRVR
ncbi:MAG: thiamine pyrophosphate-dependent enzyme [Chloroflexota bacterium]